MNHSSAVVFISKRLISIRKAHCVQIKFILDVAAVSKANLLKMEKMKIFNVSAHARKKFCFRSMASNVCLLVVSVIISLKSWNIMEQLKIISLKLFATVSFLLNQTSQTSRKLLCLQNARIPLKNVFHFLFPTPKDLFLASFLIWNLFILFQMEIICKSFDS